MKWNWYMRVKRKPMYHDYICIYMFQYDWIDMMCDGWIIYSYVTILVEMKSVYWGFERKTRYYDYICIYMLQYDWIDMMCDGWIICSYVTILVEMKLVYWEFMFPWCMNDVYICNLYDWNEIKVLEIEKKSRYQDCIFS